MKIGSPVLQNDFKKRNAAGENDDDDEVDTRVSYNISFFVCIFIFFKLKQRDMIIVGENNYVRGKNKKEIIHDDRKKQA